MQPINATEVGVNSIDLQHRSCECPKDTAVDGLDFISPCFFLEHWESTIPNTELHFPVALQAY